MPLKLNRTVEATEEVVTNTELKLHAKIDLDDDDLLVTALNAMATEHVQDVLQRSLVEETWTYHLDDWPTGATTWANEAPIELFRVPLVSVTSVTYVDTDGVTQTLAADQYIVDDKAEPGAIYRAFQVTWPTVRNIVNAITVTFVAGEGSTAALVHEKYKLLIKLVFTHLYEHREAMKDKTWVEIPQHLTNLLNKYSLQVFG